MKTFLRLLAAAVCVASAAANAQSGVKPGDAAPALQIAEWVKGEPVNVVSNKENEIVVVEFWATWCPPCLMNIPHLTETQKKFQDKGVKIVGVSNEDVDTVKRFVRKKGDEMNYTVAVDDSNATTTAYMGTGPEPIPAAFIVQNGKVMWKGSGFPMVNLERTIQELLDGKFDVAIGLKRELARERLSNLLQGQLAQSGGSLKQELAELEKLDSEIGGIVPGQKFSAKDVLNSVKFDETLQAYQKAVLGDAGTNELAQLDAQLKELSPAGFDLAGFKGKVDFLKTFDRYYLAVTHQANTNQIPALAKRISQGDVKDARLLNALAWVLLTDSKIKDRDVSLATHLAKAAVDASEEQEIMPLHTYSRALFESGKTAEAIEWEKKAVALAPDENVKSQLEATIKEYQTGKPKAD